MNKTKLFFALLIYFQIGSAFFYAAQAQSLQTSEIGFGIGGLNYKGEIAPEYNLGTNSPGFTLFYRYDVSKPLTLKANIVYGLLRARDASVDEPLHQVRKAILNGSLLELSGGFEYNFLDFYDLRREIRWTPYYFLSGAGYLLSRSVTGPGSDIEGDDVILSFSIPTGFGVKYALNKHWNLGLEVGARKIFTDDVDNLNGGKKQAGFANPYDNDWYFYNGFSISYTFYKILCPTHYNSKPSPLD